jgi:3-hydroxy-3-methylglutaryl CoA synthase
MSVGIHAHGGYVPATRLSRGAIAAAHTWFNPGLRGLAKGERAVCNWDEDSLTMAVEAVRDSLGDDAAPVLDALYFASTTAPFQDRHNAGVIAEALSLGPALATLDVGGCQRAGTSALCTALKVARGGDRVMVAAGEKRRTRAASPLELTTGDAAAAFLVAEGPGLAEALAQASSAVDFVDHYRGQDEAFDYVWEERWIRDEGFMKLVPPVVEQALAGAGIAATDIDHFVFPSAARRVAGMLAKRLQIPESAVTDNLQGHCGEAGSAHALVMLSHCLQQAGPGERILVVGFGQGVDAMVFRTTEALAAFAPRTGVAGCLQRGRADDNYPRYLAINELVNMERGLRAEVDKQTGLTTLYRNKEMLLALQGGRCEQCGTLQFPRSNVCVSPNCQAVDSQAPHSFANMSARLNSYTADRLTYSPSPPAYYGMVQFDQGGRAMMDFTDVDAARELSVGCGLRMMFRIKDIDARRGFRRYFWKAAPVYAAQGD